MLQPDGEMEGGSSAKPALGPRGSSPLDARVITLACVMMGNGRNEGSWQEDEKQS